MTPVANSYFSGGQPEQGQPGRPLRKETNTIGQASWSVDAGRWPVESPVCTGNDGFPGELADISFPDWSEKSIAALGNAIVPQIAYEIFKAIEQYETVSPWPDG